MLPLFSSLPQIGRVGTCGFTKAKTHSFSGLMNAENSLLFSRPIKKK